MAKIQLDQEVLDVEELIDDNNHDEAFRQLILLRDRLGRRPEYRYLKALFDMTFEIRSHKELLPDVRSLVTEQPDFLEAVSLLAVLLKCNGDHDLAMVFAREAVHAPNKRTRTRALTVLGDASSPVVDDKPMSERSGSSTAAADRRSDGSGVQRPLVMPTPRVGMKASMQQTQEMFTVASEAISQPSDLSSSSYLPTQPPLFNRSEYGGTLNGLPRAPSVPPLQSRVNRGSTMPPSQTASEPPGHQYSSSPPTNQPEPALRLANSEPSSRSKPSSQQTLSQPSPVFGPEPPTRNTCDLAADIPFFPTDMAVPPPPTISPDPTKTDTSEPPTVVSKPPQGMNPSGVLSSPRPAPLTSERAKGTRTSDRSASTRHGPKPLPPQFAVERTGIDRIHTPRVPSRPTMAIPEPSKQVRSWFQYARRNQLLLAQDGEFSTARTLLDLAERVVEGSTPLSADPMPLDRRGLLMVEERLKPMRNQGGSHFANERGAVTAAAAFLLSLLLKECDGKASDTSAEDGACKVVVPSGATVRPLLVAAAYSRSRGPGLVETFDRAATAHMRRNPTRRTGSGAITEPVESNANRIAHQVSDCDLTVLRRDLDASTLGVLNSKTDAALQPSLDMRGLATEFWGSDLGREIGGSSSQVGAFTIADIDALERYASKRYGVVGFAPPGTPWPWSPSEEKEKLVLYWGAILGEVLVGLYFGRWEADPGNPEDRHLYRVVLSGGVVAWPVAKAYLRLARGIVHDLSVYVDVVGRAVGRLALSGFSGPGS